ncbi:PSB28 [Auxenochlorella protothecoides x Auxenochlorella symbiontica]
MGHSMPSSTALRCINAQSLRPFKLARHGMGRSSAACRTLRMIPAAAATSLEFVKGKPEPSVPEVKLTRSRDGSSGVATFRFPSPSVFQEEADMSDITGLYMNDEEGTLTTVEVTAKFVNGKPDAIEAKYVMRSAIEWDRFMRFMERYAEEQGLGFTKG